MLQLQNIFKRLGDFDLKEINLTIDDGEYFVILGPTGTGKTVVLETIAGRYPPDTGKILFNNQLMNEQYPEERNIGFVYQDYALFPHLNVKENILFGLKIQKVSKSVMEEKLKQMTELLQIEHLLHRYPETLSGGEQQRAALARALVISNEALVLADRIAIMHNGTVTQLDTPEKVFRHPESNFVAKFVGSQNIFEGEILTQDDRKLVKLTEDLSFEVVTEERGKVNLAIRPEEITISQEPFSLDVSNSYQGIVTKIEKQLSIVEVTVNIGIELISHITYRSLEEMGLKKNEEVYLTFKSSSLHIF